MRHLLSFIIAVIALSVFFVIYANKPEWLTLEFNHPTVSEDTAKTIPDFKEVQKTVAEIMRQAEEDGDGETVIYGDTLTQYDNATVYFSGGETGIEEVESMGQSILITVREGEEPDTCVIVDMHSGVMCEGETISILLGIDTMRFNARELPDRINLLNLYADNKDWKSHDYYHSFQISDSSWNCEFFFQAYLPQNVPTWTREFIKTVISKDIIATFLDNKGPDRILKGYYGINPEPKRLRETDAASATPEQIAAHYARELERLYRRDFDKVDEDGKKQGPKYDYLFKMNPVWQSRDKRYITYRFYTYYYTMGMHGFMEEYYLTFDSETGQLLGSNELFRPDGTGSVIKNLEKRLNEYKHQFTDPETVFTADLEERDIESNSPEIIKETISGKIYPRPAITDAGVVFSYQPYEMEVFAEGVLHFVIPYSEISKTICKKPLLSNYEKP